MFVRFLASLCFLASVVSHAVAAGDLAQPDGRVILTISGKIGETNRGDTAVFDRDMLSGIDWTEIEGHTAWTEGPQRWAGPRLSAVLQAVKASGDSLSAVALNDYRVTIPASDAEEYGVILALDHNGKPMPVRKRGPIFVIYPLTEAQAKSKAFNSRMIWQLKSIKVE